MSPNSQLARQRSKANRYEGRRCRECLLLMVRFPMHICDMLLGYARVSTDDQDLSLQKAALAHGPSSTACFSSSATTTR